MIYLSSVRFKFTFLFFFLLGVGSASANIVLTAGDHTVELSSAASWTVNSITKGGRGICEPSLSSQGSVLSIDGAWAGSKHGNEELVDVELFVDGVEQNLIDGLSYNGNRIEITRTSVLGDAYLLTSIMTITPDFSNERVTFQGLDGSKEGETFYGFLGSRSNRLTGYAAFDISGSLLYSGSNDNSDNRVAFGDTPAVAQYDPLVGGGVLSVITETGGSALSSFISDRVFDNKLYFRFLDAEGPAATSNFFEFNRSLWFFEAGPEAWQETTALLVLQSNPEPATIFLLAFGGLVLLRKRSA